MTLGFVLTASLDSESGPKYSGFSYMTAEEKNTPDRNVCVSLIKEGHCFSYL